MSLPDTLSPFFNALAFAAEQHQYQGRGGYKRLPYINHIIKVTQTLIDIGKEKDRPTIIAAILHDVVEDSAITIRDVAGQFGEEVAFIVAELTDDMRLPYDQRKQLQVDKASQLSLAARKIRITDKASNIRDIFSYPLTWTTEKKRTYVENSIQIVDQIRGTNKALEGYFDEAVAFSLSL